MLDHDDDHPLHFPSDIAKLLQICYIGYFGYAWLCTPEVIQSYCRKLSCYLQAKKHTSDFTTLLPQSFFWRHCKDMQTPYFGCFGHAWLHTPTIIVSTCRWLRCSSTCKKNFIIHILKDFKICLADSILDCNSRTRIFLDMGLEINNPRINFIFLIINI